MNPHLKGLLVKTELNLKQRDQSNAYLDKLYSHAHTSKQVLGLLSICGLPFIAYLLSPFPWTIKLPVILFSAYCALLIFALYKDYDLKLSINSYNLQQAELLDLCFRVAKESGAKLQIEPRIGPFDINFTFASTSTLELKAVLREGENEMPFFDASIPLSNYMVSTFEVQRPTDKKIRVWFNKKTLTYLKERL